VRPPTDAAGGAADAPRWPGEAASGPDAACRPRVLVACVGNVLRLDDGFGVAVATELAAGGLPPGAELIETGIGGLGIVQQLMDGYDGLLVVDALDRGAAPGTLFVLEPDVEDPAGIPFDAWQDRFSNLHLTEPSRVFLLARALGVLPARVLLVGCQIADVEGLGQHLSPPVRAASIVAPASISDARARARAAGVAHTEGVPAASAGGPIGD
jgi:hydrogenase maturation protease